ncbi:hypothetical protein REMIM1_PC00093 (plasmid) [Rhizobium etli bv. mimosae str. Mim1]|nr:hypothetical protein REMIM1_PC00093 [Rhizobium etli bv. mimosae str. Mim1]
MVSKATQQQLSKTIYCLGLVPEIARRQLYLISAKMRREQNRFSRGGQPRTGSTSLKPLGHIRATPPFDLQQKGRDL